LKNKSFIIKILLFFILTAAVFLTLIFLFFFDRLKNESIKNVKTSLENYSGLLEDEMKILLQKKDIKGLENYIKNKAKSLNIRVTYIETNGNVITDTNEEPSFMENHFYRPEVQLALKGKSAYSTRLSGTLKKNMIYYAHPIEIENKVAGILRLSVFIDDIDRIVFELQLKYIIAAIILGFISILCILIIYFNFKKEIKRFSEISEKVSKGDFDIEFPKNDSYEIAELSNSFKNMIIKIKELIFELTSEKEEIDNIISSINEGMIVIDKNGLIIRANESFLNIVKNKNIIGKYYWEILRNNEIKELIKSIGDENSINEIQIYDKIFITSINYLSQKKEIVLIFYDVSELKKIERIKKDFVTNVSHELGTPLTAIKGFVETLSDEEKDAQKIKYLDIISRHTDRLINLVKDLKLLTYLDNNKNSDSFEPVNLSKIIENVLPIFTARAAEKNIKISFEADEKEYVVNGDIFRLEQLFINLLDNAMKYTEEGEVKIKIFKENENVFVEVIDTGIGISDNDKARVFERFYIVDKSRSQKLGGTGLGLSIVKHIAISHKAEVSIKNNHPKGTKFIIKF